MQLYFLAIVYLALLLMLAFTALAFASALSFCAELSMEHPSTSKTIVRYIIYALLALHVIGLFTSSLSLLCLALGIISHLVHLHLLSHYPDFPVASLAFAASMMGVLISQAAWYYSLHPTQTFQRSSNYDRPTVPQCITFYLLMVWLVPIIFFVTANVQGNIPLYEDTDRVTPTAASHGVGLLDRLHMPRFIARFFDRRKDPILGVASPSSQSSLHSSQQQQQHTFHLSARNRFHAS